MEITPEIVHILWRSPISSVQVLWKLLLRLSSVEMKGTIEDVLIPKTDPPLAHPHMI